MFHNPRVWVISSQVRGQVAAVGGCPARDNRHMALNYGLCLTVQAHSQEHLSARNGAGDKQCLTVLRPIKVVHTGWTLHLDFLDQLAPNRENFEAVCGY